MLKIRQAQLRAFSNYRLAVFVDELVAHLRQSLPDHCAALGPRGTHDLTAQSLETAQRYGLTSEECAACFVRLAFLFGENFHTTQPWASQALRDLPGDSEFAKTGRLAQAAMAHLKQAAGA